MQITIYCVALIVQETIIVRFIVKLFVFIIYNNNNNNISQFKSKGNERNIEVKQIFNIFISVVVAAVRGEGVRAYAPTS